MVLIITGTLELPFNRLLDCCLDYFRHQQDTAVILQNPVYQPPALPAHIKFQPLIPTKNMLNLYTQASFIISAAGEGTLLEMLPRTPHKPLLFPRDPRFREHVDQQQLKIAQEMKNRGWCEVALNCVDLKQHLKKQPEPNKLQRQTPQPPSALLEFLHTITTS